MNFGKIKQELKKWIKRRIPRNGIVEEEFEIEDFDHRPIIPFGE